MKLILKRSQKSGMMSSKMTFMLDAQTQLTDDEKNALKKYKLGKEVVYSKVKLDVPWAGGLGGVAARLAEKAMNITVTVDDLVNGKHLECKEITEMLAVEEQLLEASQVLKKILVAATHFEGEEVIEI